MRLGIVIGSVLLALSAGAASAAKMSDAELLRQQAEHLCYDDVQRLCNDSIPDEDKITACMKAKHAQLSPACAKVFDKGIAGN